MCAFVSRKDLGIDLGLEVEWILAYVDVSGLVTVLQYSRQTCILCLQSSSNEAMTSLLVGSEGKVSTLLGAGLCLGADTLVFLRHRHLGWHFRFDYADLFASIMSHCSGNWCAETLLSLRLELSGNSLESVMPSLRRNGDCSGVVFSQT